ncbi:MAG: DUF2298 domain-containing protein, partial [Candidatus Aureabacteria bacterium]|nr:DUF2298 domain-containing protein [Candidatus Auribacterota bacterium]
CVVVVGGAGAPRRRALALAAGLAAVVGMSVLLFLPFRLAFHPAARAQLGWVEAAKRSPLGGFLTVNGLGLFTAASLLVTELSRCASPLRVTRGAFLWMAGGLGAAMALATGCAAVGLLSALLLAAIALLISRCDIAGERLFVILLALLVIALFLGCEFVYLKDFYGERLQRQNTVFKFYFQAWILLSVIFACGVEWVRGRLPQGWRYLWLSALILLIGAALIYPVLGTYHRCGRFRGGGRGSVPYLPTLDGAAYIRHLYPAEGEALQWVRENIPADQVILEATGDPYSFHGRVATFTGHPTVLGWGNQESLWRDWSWKTIQERTQNIKTMYDEPNKASVMPLMKRYGIRYVYVGTLEKKKYRDEGLAAFGASWPVVYRNSEISIFKTPERQ